MSTTRQRVSNSEPQAMKEGPPLPSPSNAEIAYFENCRAKSGGRNVRLDQFLNWTREGRWAQPIEELRRSPYKSSAYEAIKKRLPCFMLSGSTGTGGHKASDIGKHTGLLQLDLDGTGEAEAALLRDRLANDPHILAAWISPGCVGVKGIMLIPASIEHHRRAFKAAQNYMRERHDVEIDKSCSDPSRLCFVSFDADLKLNPAATPLAVDAAPALPPEARFDGGRHAADEDSSESLNPDSEYESCILHNTHDLFHDFPALLPFYDQHVRQKLGTPARGLRNAALVELVAGNVCVVHQSYVLAFADVFHRENPDIFADYPHEEWMGQAQNLLNGCLTDYAKKNLGPEELAIYETCKDDNHTAAFRICRSLAQFDGDPSTPPPEFYLSAVQLGSRLGVLDMQAWRIMKALEKNGAILETKKGTLRRFRQKATATRWRWQLLA